MAVQPRFSPEQIAAARQRLRELPLKEVKKSREETAQLLAKDFRKALKKGS